MNQHKPSIQNLDFQKISEKLLEQPIFGDTFTKMKHYITQVRMSNLLHSTKNEVFH